MRRYMLLIVAFVFSLMVLMQLSGMQVRANTVLADVDIDPDSLILKEDGGKWITAYICLPEPYDINNIDVSTVTLEVMQVCVPKSRYDIQGDMLVVKFDRAVTVNLLLPMIEHMSPHVKQEVTLEVTGSFYDGSDFQGSDTIKVFFT